MWYKFNSTQVALRQKTAAAAAKNSNNFCGARKIESGKQDVNKSNTEKKSLFILWYSGAEGRLF